MSFQTSQVQYPTTADNKRVLLVEDEKAMQIRLSALLNKRGYEVIIASDGVRALELLDQYTDIQLVLSDWLMPNMDGIELCKQVKSGCFARYMFFVLLSSQDDQASIIHGMNAGADDFIAKNTSVDELDARIKAGFRNLALHNQLATKNDELNSAYARVHQELMLANELLSQLLPTKTHYTNVELSYVSMPSTEIGGDTLGCIELDENYLAFYIIDVSGHGVASALLSFSVHQTLSIFEGVNSVVMDNTRDTPAIRSPADVLFQLNEIYCQAETHQLYFSMIYAVLNQLTGEVDLAFSGHPPLVWYQAKEQQVKLIGADGFVVGMFDFASYESMRINLSKGDELWLYTDGITEAKQNNELFGENRLCQAVSDLAANSFSCKAKLLVNEIKQWQSDKDFADDVSLIGIKWK
ncbi:PP2C family protein-serine/threonine phosphatase [Vibrio mediterranei]|jgi:sigma-B regulation protein RsbU (phosphoserine phosphatase)|uniref:Regulator n=1 Tax=Vibrio mediterranei TaxID=689 RepID=A0ABX5D670_9VIBR|nr:SpoIIE family protein phosphatase [Vibrio mediterranei]MCG9659560.1 SpoIIE family protein phosphatase [Vibrio mediterranei]MCG9664832.1 SpoIIE family protein phosphatase [Vibrio mediterranei]PCD89689.1 regulator [Vibrio mediterranei]PRQ65092.1 regulator [Vibrio mediterranei]PTC04597.1 fused response regulator/phosphatase [Vibrio mediterranei]